MLANWLSEYNATIGLSNAAMIMTTFGGFCVTFAVCICWPKMVELYGAIGGMLCAAFIVGTFWVMNHKLPGFGIHPEQLQNAAGDTMQYGLIHQAHHLGSPWIDMGFAIGMGFLAMGLVESKKGTRLASLTEFVPRWGLVIIGGIIGGAIVGMSTQAGAELFGWESMKDLPFPGN